MHLGMIGLGRMGASLVRRLAKDGHQCVVYDVNPAALKKIMRWCGFRQSGVVCDAQGVWRA